MIRRKLKHHSICISVDDGVTSLRYKPPPRTLTEADTNLARTRARGRESGIDVSIYMFHMVKPMNTIYKHIK
ncbi:hypothetical protein TRIP_E120024 [uncultured Spirochaetota bacterium]|nr:hypothetical protein TRIP_E120024 [uncultured Spirochaetota bacterium]